MWRRGRDVGSLQLLRVVLGFPRAQRHGPERVADKPGALVGEGAHKLAREGVVLRRRRAASGQHGRTADWQLDDRALHDIRGLRLPARLWPLLAAVGVVARVGAGNGPDSRFRPGLGRRWRRQAVVGGQHDGVRGKELDGPRHGRARVLGLVLAPADEGLSDRAEDQRPRGRGRAVRPGGEHGVFLRRRIRAGQRVAHDTFRSQI
mmetsp:Transcript_23425/g.70363  ORF Transcript_23425/g.70363 Transcript_23425/m.70363 type:complete len:205 (+) Transcript_23425:503-1117(+)